MKIIELLQQNLFPNEGYANIEGYDYGRVFNNGTCNCCFFTFCFLKNV